MTVEEARAALAEAEINFEKAKGTGVSKVAAASKALSAAKRALATAEKAEAAGVNVGGISRAEQISTIRQAEYTATQEEAGRGEKPIAPPPDDSYTYEYFWRPEVGGRGGYWNLVRFPKLGSTTSTNASTSNASTSNASTSNASTQFDWSGYKFDASNRLYLEGNLFTGTYQSKKYVNGSLDTSSDTTGNNANINTASNIVTGTTLTSAQQNVYSTIVDRLNRYNLGGLAPLIKKLAIEGATEATIMLRLQDEPIYQERFKANQSRISKGLKALTPADYLTLEDDYRQVLRAYGLKQFDNDAYVSQFLANDISVSELSNRVVTAVQRVRNADPAVSSMLKNYYGITNNDLVAYVLDPNQQFQKIERQVAASEIGVAAGRQGFNIGVPVAEQLAAQGITQAEAQRGYATIADILPTAEKLSDIYGTTLESYGLAEGEQEVFNQLASAQRKRQRLVSREVAEFSGQAGVGRGSLGTAKGGQY